jgi:hypothetical protein
MTSRAAKQDLTVIMVPTIEVVQPSGKTYERYSKHIGRCFFVYRTIGSAKGKMLRMA